MVGERGIKKYLWVCFFLFPSLLGLIFFKFIPILASLGLTLFKWDLLTPPQFIFLSNFLKLFHDAIFWSALGHTLYYIAGYIPLVLILGLLLALIMNQNLKGRVIFRTGFFIPVVSSWVAVALLWKWIFNPKFGIFNYFLSLAGIQGPAWLFDPQWAMPLLYPGFFFPLYLRLPRCK